ncbi:hypothetical protein L7F22_007571, partial [Adiantum nelumboides]|nr:hypothetical protein [Adiantum nelumboides]
MPSADPLLWEGDTVCVVTFSGNPASPKQTMVQANLAATCAANSQALLHVQVLLHAPAQPLGAEADGVATCTETPRLSQHPVLAVKTTQARPAATGETPSFPAASSCPAADADDAGDAIIMDAFLRNLKAEDSATDEDPTVDEDLGVAVLADTSADATVLAALDTTSTDNSTEPKLNTIFGDDDDATVHLDAVEGNAALPSVSANMPSQSFWEALSYPTQPPAVAHLAVHAPPSEPPLQVPQHCEPAPLASISKARPFEGISPVDEDCALVHSTQNRPFASFAAIEVNSFSCGNAATLFAHGAATSFGAGLHANTAARMVHANHPLRAPVVGTINQANHRSALDAAKSARASVTDATVSPQLRAHATLAPIAMSGVPFNRYIGENLLTQTPNLLLCQ